MLHRVAIFTLITAFSLSTTPSIACTGISLKAEDGAAIRGRTLEFGFPMGSNVIVIPAGKEFSGTLPDGGKGLTYTTRYGIVGADALNLPVILDGINDQGLAVGLFYFPGYASFTPVTADNAKRALAPHEFGLWVLANFATVDEVKAGVKDIVLVPTPAKGLGSPQGAVAPAHFFIQDKSGKSIAIEPVDNTLKVHDAPLGIMTNAPTYDWHMTNLNNYLNLSVKDVDSEKLGPVTLNAVSSGFGLHGLPGDFTSPSRFVRAAIFGQAATPNPKAEDAVFSAFHILNQFDIPKGSVINASVGSAQPETTEWTSVSDLKNLRWYFRTFEDQSIRMVDLKEALEAAKGAIMTISMESKQPFANVSADVESGN
ncbi:MAG: choloylglycine hydrolase family protein [Alphaproteobacteria bacterium]|nr:choloylglycine hydrolase family protein [Alphaproteobacteria bacterium]